MKRVLFAICTAGLLSATLMSTWGCDLVASHEQHGTLRVLLTDNPFPYELVDEANATITRVEVVVEGSGHITLSEEVQSFNLLELQGGVTALLAEKEIPEGSYRQLRLIVSGASVVLIDGTTFDLKVPSGAQTGIKVLTDFQIEADSETTITLDFDVEQSFLAQGNISTPAGISGFIFTPVIKAVAVVEPGDE